MRVNIRYCSHRAARYAVENWHYSGVMPTGKAVMIGVWEDSSYRGVVIFSRGSAPRLGQSWGVSNIQVCELTRIALREHQTPVSQVVASALRMLKQTNPGLRVVFSFADPEQNHHGGVYQAGNWIYTGVSEMRVRYWIHGRYFHERSVHNFGWKNQLSWIKEHVDPSACTVTSLGKHRYAMPLDRGMRRYVRQYSQPYPNPVVESYCGRSVNGNALAVQARDAGSIPVVRSTRSGDDRG